VNYNLATKHWKVEYLRITRIRRSTRYLIESRANSLGNAGQSITREPELKLKSAIYRKMSMLCNVQRREVCAKNNSLSLKRDIALIKLKVTQEVVSTPIIQVLTDTLAGATIT
jgi:hypothetical protein